MLAFWNVDQLLCRQDCTSADGVTAVLTPAPVLHPVVCHGTRPHLFSLDTFQGFGRLSCAGVQVLQSRAGPQAVLGSRVHTLTPSALLASHQRAPGVSRFAAQAAATAEAPTEENFTYQAEVHVAKAGLPS